MSIGRLELQLSEMEMLQSMFGGDGELTLDDPDMIQVAALCVAGLRTAPPRPIAFTVRLSLRSVIHDIPP